MIEISLWDIPFGSLATYLYEYRGFWSSKCHKRVPKMEITPKERKGSETNIKCLEIEDSRTWSKEEKLDC